MTTTAHTAESLEARTNADIRSLYLQVIGKKAVAKSRQFMIAAIIAAQATSGTDSTNDQDSEPRVVDTDTQATDDDSQEPVVVNEATVEPDTDQDATMVDPDATEPEVTEATSQEPVAPTKVRVVGTGGNHGSVLLCDLASRTGAMARVQVLGKMIRFHADSGIPCRVPKAWGSGGWQLDIESLPPVVEPTVAEMIGMRSRDLTIEQLQQVFEHLSGRETTSTTRTYLCNMVRLAKAGTLPTGSGRRSRGTGKPLKVLPVGLPVSVVVAMDAAWKRLGYGSRISFIRDALKAKLSELGEDEVAEMVLR